MGDTIASRGCGTVACIAGRACLLAKFPRYIGTSAFLVLDCAEKLLGISRDDAAKLFYESGWPDQFQAPYDELWSKALSLARECARLPRSAKKEKRELQKLQKQMANIACKRITHFLRTGE